MADQASGRVPPADGAGGDRRQDIERLVRDHHAELFRYAFRLCGTQADAEDVTQQTFLIAQAKIDQLRDDTKARPWLYSIARSCFLKSRRKAGPVAASVVNLDLDGFPTRGGAGEEIDQERLNRALAQLPDEARVILNLFYFEDASYRDIAETLEVRLGTVMSRLSRAKEKLRRLLFESGEGNELSPAAEVSPSGARSADT